MALVTKLPKDATIALETLGRHAGEGRRAHGATLG